MSLPREERKSCTVSWNTTTEVQLLIVIAYSVKRNQNSPLLRLPAELRTQIWNYVLGYKLLSMWYTYKLPLRQARIAAPYTDRTNVMDLLRTCRQIYVESACVPYSLNIFSFDFYDSIYDHFKRFTLHQRANITHIQLNNLDHFSLQLLTQQPIEVVAKQKKFNLSFLPALKQIHVVLLAAQFDAAQEGRGHMVEDQLKVLLAGSRNVEILLETTSKTKTWDKYVAG